MFSIAVATSLRRFADRRDITPDEISRIIHSAEPEIQKRAQAAIERLGRAVVEAALISAAAGGIEAALASLPWQRFTFDLASAYRDVFKDVMDRGAKLGIRSMPATAVVDIRFDQISQAAVRWMERYSATRIKGIVDETRSAIRGVMYRGLSEGKTVRQIAREVRQHIGLLDRDVRALQRYHDGLIKRGRKPEDIERLLARRRQLCINRRAMNIARTESTAATNEGVLQAWREGVRIGTIDPRRARKKWLTTKDDRACERCLAMHGKTVEIDGSYSEPDRRQKSGRVIVGEIAQRPPLHPQCRCGMSLVYE
jgi:hypothetical protein